MDVTLDDAVLERARADFFAHGIKPHENVVRPAVLASWKRSARHGLRPDSIESPAVAQVDTESQLLRATRPLIEHRADWLSESPYAMALTEADGSVLGCWVNDKKLTKRMDARRVVPGYRFGEGDVGTGSVGIAIEAGVSFLVVGREHFADDSWNMTSAGAPIRHPVTKRLLGSLNMCCDVRDTTPLMLQMVRDIVGLIESRILDESSESDRFLLARYLRGSRARHPVMYLNERTVIGNAAAMKLLPQIDHTALWEVASRAVRTPPQASFSIPSLNGDEPVSVSAAQLLDGGSVVGIELRLGSGATASGLGESTGPRMSSTSHSGPLTRLAGRSEAWRQFCAQLNTAFADAESVLVWGERGVGRTRILRAFADAHCTEVIDAAGARADPGTTWSATLDELKQSGTDLIVLDNLECLTDQEIDLTHSWLGTLQPHGPRVLAGRAVAEGEAVDGPDDEISDWPGVAVRVPSVYERLGDMPLLLEALTAERTGRALSPRWTDDAVRVLSRVPWRANVKSLDRLVVKVVRRQAGPYIRVEDLPADIVAAATRYELSGLGRVEAQAIMAAMAQAEGNKKRAADILGIARSTLYRKVRALGLDMHTAVY